MLSLYSASDRSAAYADRVRLKADLVKDHRLRELLLRMADVAEETAQTLRVIEESDNRRRIAMRAVDSETSV